MNQKELLYDGISKLQHNNIEDCFLKARMLIEFTLQESRSEFLMKELQQVSKETIMQYEIYLQELIHGKPIQYITHQQSFMGLNFFVDENVLIPQPDTEVLVEQAFKIADSNFESIPSNSFIKILDIGTGSGAIAVSLAKELKKARITAIDISKKALEVAKKNARLHEVEIEFIESNLFQNITQTQFDMIVSNPPYIETKVISTLSKEVQNEPFLALDGGEDGLTIYRNILKQAHKYLKAEGYLLLEMGYDQGKELLELAKETGWKVPKHCIIKDYHGENRVLILRR